MAILQRARKDYELCRGELLKSVPELSACAAIGFAGTAPACFGLDPAYSSGDEIRFIIWLDVDAQSHIHDRLDTAIARISRKYFRNPEKRIAVFGAQSFYRTLTGLGHPPCTWREWLLMPEDGCACAVNGEIFEDFTDGFSAWRGKLLKFYPRQVWLKKISMHAETMSHAGQLELPLALRNNNPGGALLALATFAQAALSFTFLLSRQYPPPYLFAPLLCANAGRQGQALAELLRVLASHPLHGGRDLAVAEMVEDFCAACATHLNAQEPGTPCGNWLYEQALAIRNSIDNPRLRNFSLPGPR